MVAASSAGISFSSPSVRASSTNPRVITSGVSSSAPGLLADRDDRHDQPVAREVPPVAQDLVADLAAAGPVDQDPAGRHLSGDPPPLVVEPQQVAVFGQQDAGGPGHPGGDPGVPRELPVLSMYRHEVLRPDQ